MGSKSLEKLLISYILFASWVSSGNAQHVISQAENGGPPTECIQKLLPCQPYLHSSPEAPPGSCCLPLKEMVSREAACLCSVITNSEILKSFNFSKDDALNLGKACGANADLSTCKNVYPPTSPAAPIPSNSSAKSSSSEKKSGGHRMYNLERCNFMSLVVSLMSLALSAY